MTFRTQDQIADALAGACEVIGESEEGRPIYGAVLGRGEESVSLVAGAHSDEPVGPETLRALVLDGAGDLDLERYRFVVVPHVNPDGEARNRAWIERWPDPRAYLQHVFREPPGRDVEFGYPDLRVENRAVAAFLARHAPYALHMSLHSMAVAEGALLLIERHWVDRTVRLRLDFAAAAGAAGLRLHDHDRKGEKGFAYIGPGFWTTPEGALMSRYFRERGDPETAALFRQSSMEYVRSLGGDPLCLVTELPLFVLENDAPEAGVPTAYLAFHEHLRAGGAPDEFDLRPLPLRTAMALQLEALALGLRAVTALPGPRGAPGGSAP